MNSNDMDRVIQASKLVQLLEQRSAQAVQQSQQSAGALQRAAQEAAHVSQNITAEALEEFRRVASQAVAEGLRYPLEDAEKKLQHGVASIEAATQTLNTHMKAQRARLAAYAWKTFIASALASLTMIGVAVYMAVHAHQEITRSEWISQINAAIANGKLAACSEGGLCAYAGKKAIRLDQ